MQANQLGAMAVSFVNSGGSCGPAGCGQPLVMHFVKVSLSLRRGQASLDLQAAQCLAGREAFT